MPLKHKTKFGINIFSRGKAIFLLSLIFVSTVTTLPILQSTNVGAVNTAAGMTVESENKIKSLIYYKAISWCFSASSLDKRQIVNTDAISGDWFKDTITTANVGIYSAGGLLPVTIARGSGNPYSRAIMECSKTGWVKDALTLWGLDPIRVLCNSGFRTAGKDLFSNPESLEDCYDNQASVNAYGTQVYTHLIGDAGVLFAQYITDQVYGGNDPNSVASITGAEWYLFFKGSLKASCIPSIDGPVQVAPATNDPDIDYWFETPYVDPLITPPVVTMVWHKGVLKKDIQVAVGPLATNGNDGENIQSCQWMVDRMVQYADDYKNWVAANQPAAIEKEKRDKTNIIGGKTSCAVEGVGWIVCPIVNFLAGIADGAFGFLANNFLQTKPEIFNNNSNNPTFKAWGTMRSFANIAFVIAFLIIIFSQLTSIGITNYGIKKLLPRLIIAAVLVNISYYICQIAVDLSNILGWSLKDLLEGIAKSAGIPTAASWTTTGGQFGTTALAVLSVGGGAVGLGIAAWTSLATLIPVLLAALVALVMILFILVARQALIILLIVISPLAFVAFLLPNTEDWFKKWQKAFTTMLLLFPIIALVFGMSSLASSILRDAFASGTGINMFAEIIAAAVMALPLFVVPGLLKKALDGVGTIGGKISALGDKWGGSLGKKSTEGFAKSRLGQYQAYTAGERAKRAALIQSGAYKGRGFNGLASRLNKRFNESPISGAHGDRLAASGIALADKMEREEMANEVIRINNNPTANLEEMLNDSLKDDGNSVRARAITSIYLTKGAYGVGKINEAITKAETPQNSKSSLFNNLRKDIGAAGIQGKDYSLASWTYDKDTRTLSEVTKDPEVLSKMSKLSGKDLGGQNLAILKNIEKSISGNQAREALNNPSVFAEMDEDKKAFFRGISDTDPVSPINTPPPNPGPTPPLGGSSAGINPSN